MEEENESFAMTTNLILPSSFPSYQPEKNEVVCIDTFACIMWLYFIMNRRILPLVL